MKYVSRMPFSSLFLYRHKRGNDHFTRDHLPITDELYKLYSC